MMNRRRFCSLSVGSAAFVCGASAQPVLPRRIKTRFRTSIESEKLIALSGLGQRAFSLTQSVSGQVWLRQLDPARAAVTRSWPAPAGRITAVSFDQQGTPTLLELQIPGGAQVHRLTPDGRFLSTRISLGIQYVVSHVVIGNEYWFLTSTNEVRAVSIESGKPTRRPAVVSGLQSGVLWPGRDGGVRVVDRAAGVVSDVSGDGTITAITLQAPELGFGRTWLQERQKLQDSGPRSGSAISILVQAHCSLVDGSLAILPSPIRRENGATLLRFSSDGALLRKDVLELPSKEVQRFLPTQIQITPGGTCLGCPDGSVTWYEGVN